MSDDPHSPAASPADDIDRDDEETEIDEKMSDDPVVEENGAVYDPAAQAPPEAER